MQSIVNEPLEDAGLSGEHALIGDTHSTALVASSGAIEWVRLSAEGDPACFKSHCAIRLDGLQPSSRRYIGDTNILETRIEGPDGVATVTDFMVVYPECANGQDGSEADCQHRLIRMITGVEGQASGSISVKLTAGCTGEQAMLRFDDCNKFPLRTGLARIGDHRMRLESDHAIAIDGDGGAHVTFALKRGHRVFLAQSFLDNVERERMHYLDDALEDLRRTRHYWTGWAETLGHQGPERAEAVRSALAQALLPRSMRVAPKAKPVRTRAVPQGGGR